MAKKALKSDEKSLGRIRDKQRQSRARKKEHLRDLQAKVREFETMGAKANKEIQDAAKRVLKENQRLRAFISSREIPSVEADAFRMDDGSSPDSTAITTLQQAMQSRQILHKPSPGAQGDDCQTNLLQQLSTAPPQYLEPCTSVQVKPDPNLSCYSDPSRDPATLLSTSMTTFPSALSNDSYQAHGPCGQPVDIRNDTLYQEDGSQVLAEYTQYLATCYSQYWPIGYMC